MAKTSLDTKNQTFQEIMGNGVKYAVPPFQRDYTWEEEQWMDLWLDIESSIASEEPVEHYMGYIVLQDGKDKEYNIIDGQQRLTTVTCIILAALKYLQQYGEDNKLDNDRYNAIRQRYIGYIDVVSTRTENKLKLNRNNDATFRKISSKLEDGNVRRVTKTNKLLGKCFDFFVNRLKGRNGEELAIFVEKVVDALLFTVITVKDDINAYIVFETLNARGVKLSTPDLLKNFLFSTADGSGNFAEDEIYHMDERWYGITEQLGKNDFTHFLRTEWSTRYELQTKNDLFKSIKRVIKTDGDVHNYIDILEKNAPVYAALNSPDDEYWRDVYSESFSKIKRILETLKLFRIKQPMNVLLAGALNFSKQDFVKLLECIEVVSIRYNAICNKAPNEQEKVYSGLAKKISNGQYSCFNDFKNDAELRRIYPDDGEFKTAFSYKDFPGRNAAKQIKYLLFSIENRLNTLSLDIDEQTVEHILPYNPTSTWREYFGDDDVDDCINRLGNMILLPERINRSLADNDFAFKQTQYKDAHYVLADKISNYDEWNKENLTKYQEWLGKQATSVWRIDL